MNKSMYKENLSFLMERFPKLGLLAGSWSPVFSPPCTLEKLELENVKLLYIYGLGNGEGYEILKSWLHQDSGRKLVFLEDEPGYIASYLENPQAKDLLTDPQVFLELLSKGGRELDEIAERFAEGKVEVIPLDFRNGRKFRSLRLRLLRKTTLSYALHLDRLYGEHPFSNFLQNLKMIPQSFYANRMQGKFANVPAVICGAGPSLQHAIAPLKKYQDHFLLIAGGSTLAALSSEGLVPHFGMAIDPNLEEYHRFRNTFAFEVPLLYSTRVFPGVFQTCNGPFGYMRTGVGGMMEIWMEERLGLKGALIGDHLNQETMSVTAICLAWAVFLGCNPILLSGIDLAYTEKKRYAPGVDHEISWEQIQKEKRASDYLYKRQDRKGNAIYTAVRWIMEASSLSHFAKKYPKITWINTTEGGLELKKIPYQPLEKALLFYAKQRLDLKQRVQKEIFVSSMPAQSGEVLEAQLKELGLSLERVISYLEILCKEKSEGKKALAFFDLQEEIAYSCFFYDSEKRFGKDSDKWEKLYLQAQQYFSHLSGESHTHGAYCAESER